MSHIEINVYLSLAGEVSLDDDVQGLLKYDANRNSVKQDIRNNVIYAMSSGDEYVSLHVVPPVPSLEEQVEEQIDNELLHQAILDLPPAQSRRIRAYFFEGLSEREIAQREGVAQAAIHKSIVAGKRKLRKSLENLLNRVIKWG